MISDYRKFQNTIKQEEKHDRRTRRRELNKRIRKDDVQGGKSMYKKTKHKFNSLT